MIGFRTRSVGGEWQRIKLFQCFNIYLQARIELKLIRRLAKDMVIQSRITGVANQ